MTWKDVSSWSRSDVDRTPRTWELQTTDLRVVVTRHIHYPGKWVLSCYGSRLECVELRAESIDDAKREAIERARRYLTRNLEQLLTPPTETT